MGEVKHGFYSPKAAARCGTFIYLNADGGRVEVTAVYFDEAGLDYMWDDKVYMGEVTQFIGRRLPPSEGSWS